MQYLLIVLGIILGGLYGLHTESKAVKILAMEQPTIKAEVKVTPIPTPTTTEIITEIAKTFEPEGKQVIFEALNVAKNESGWRHDAINYNCQYGDVSTSCKRGDEGRAWSVDCGILQINFRGQVCPVEMFDPKKNIDHAYKMFKNRHWQPWVAARKLGYTK